MDRTLELILYAAMRLQDRKDQKNTVYWVLKSIYFADKNHLLKFGRRLHEESYIAMEDGPVPSYAYDLFKNVRFPGQRKNRADYGIPQGQFDVRNGREIVPLRDPDMDVFSESEIGCLNAAIEEIAPLSYDQLKIKSHDQAWKAASSNGPMSIEEIILAMDGGARALPYLKERMIA